MLVLTATGLALNPGRPMSQYVHNIWQTDDGLPQNYVVAIVQTHDGYIWLATQEGLVRFDGIKFTVYDKRNTHEIKDNNIQALYEDRRGTLWFGTEGGGLTGLREGKFFSYSTKDGLPSDIVDAIFEDHNGDLWIGTAAGLGKLKDGKFSTLTVKDGLASDTIIALYEDREGNLWIGTDGAGLGQYKDGRINTFTTKEGLANDLVRAICEDAEGNLWIGTRDGLSKFKAGNFTTYSTKQGLASNSVLAVFPDKDGSLWIGTDGGLNRFRDAQFTSYAKRDGLSDDSVGAICEDKEGDLWIGTYGGGLNRLKDARFTSYTTSFGLSDNDVRSILEDREGAMWIATRGGLNRIKDNKLVAYTIKQGLGNNSVLSLYEAKDGTLWVGTRSGLNRMDHGKFITYTTAQGLSDDTVLSMVEDGERRLWIGTSAGLSSLKDGKFTTYRAGEGLTNDSVWSLLADRKGALWIGTDGGGLNLLADGKFSSYTTKDGLANDVVLCIYEDAEGTLWIGTSGGLNRLREGKLAAFTAKDGLFDDVIFQILEDNNGNLWMSSNKGIFRVDKKQLDDFTEGTAGAILSISYGTADGMKSRECNGGFQPAGWKSKDGKLWFPTIKGVAVIDPSNIKLNERPPPVVIEAVLVDNELMDNRAPASLSPGKQKFEFHFTGLSFLAPEKVRFKYKLEGFDKDWVEAGTRRDASYTNLRPGNYRFRVVACNNDMVWNEAGALFEFYLKPHFYQTFSFYALCAAFLGLAAWGLYRLRLRQIQSRFSAVLRERTRMAREIHDTLAQTFVGIGLQLKAVSGQLSDSPKSAQQHLDLAQKMIRSSLAEARRSIWDLRPEALERGDLSAAFRDIARQITAGSSIDVEVETRGDSRALPPLVESNLLRIGQEALTNAIKHADPRKISVELIYREADLRLKVSDDGCGFDSGIPISASSGHFGLVGIRERADQIGGNLRLSSSPRRGTEIEVTVPWSE
jgi:ligand-binding sensor domain-containing protein/signal transduction histidine kinase